MPPVAAKIVSFIELPFSEYALKIGETFTDRQLRNRTSCGYTRWIMSSTADRPPVSSPDITTPDVPSRDDSRRDAARPRRGRPPSGGREAILVAALELLRERGAGRLTTKEVATRAGVSEGSVFYHFTDRTGLMTAVIETGLDALKAGNAARPAGEDVPSSLSGFARGVEALLDPVLTVMIAAQSDAELRTGVAGYLLANDLGPHRGVQGLGGYLAAQQADGTIRDDVDPQAVAYLLISSCFMRVGLSQMIDPSYGPELPGQSALISTLATLLKP
jgi:AcrR family transcriptional regulator